MRSSVNWTMLDSLKLDGGTIKGSSGALSRFEDSESKPFVIISQLTDTNGSGQASSKSSQARTISLKYFELFVKSFSNISV